MTLHHTLIVGPAGSGKTTRLAQSIAATRFPPWEIVALAVTRGSVTRLQHAVGELAGVMTVQHAAFLATYDAAIKRGEKRNGLARKSFAGEHMQLLERAGHVGDSKNDRAYVRGAREQITAALRLEARARLAGDDVLEHWRPEQGYPAPSFLGEVADRYEAFREANQVYDVTDLRMTVRPDPSVRVVAIDDAEDLSRADVEFIWAAYPRATWIAAGNPATAIRVWDDLAGLEALPHDITLTLAEPYRTAEPWTIESSTPSSSLVPDVEGDVLIILGRRDRWAFKRWIQWCIDVGRPFRIDDAPVWAGLPIRGIRPQYDPDSIGWRDAARDWGCSSNLIDYAGRVLARYGTLDPAELEAVVITTVARCKGQAADVAIVDGFTMRPGQGEGEELTQARWELAMSRARRRLIVLQSETNQKQRIPSG